MTPQDWHTATNPDPLIRRVWPSPPGYPDAWVAVPDLPRPVARRLRLIGVACARQVWDLLSTDDRSAVLVSERYADGRATGTDMRAISVRVSHDALTEQQYAHSAAGFAAVCHAGRHHPAGDPEDFHSWDVRTAAQYAARALARRAAGPATYISPTDPVWHDTWNAAFHAVRAEQADLVRDVFPPPGTSPAVEPGWLTSTVVALARRMYESRDFSPMPILADALQDAGCADELVLGHCRKAAPHVRGCWVVDLLMSTA